MSREIMTGDEIRVELARQRMTRVQLAKDMNLTADYIRKIVNGLRAAPERRAQITEHLRKRRAESRGQKAESREIRGKNDDII